MVFICDVCYKSFTHKRNLIRHNKSIHQSILIPCDQCALKFKRNCTLKQHKKTCHSNEQDEAQQQYQVQQQQQQQRQKSLNHQEQHQVAKIGKRSGNEVEDEGISKNKRSKCNVAGTSKSSLKKCEYCKIDVPKDHWNHHLGTNEHKDNASTPYSERILKIDSIYGGKIELFSYLNKDENKIMIPNFLSEAKHYIIKLLEDMVEKHQRFKVRLDLKCEYLKLTADIEEDPDSNFIDNTNLFNSAFRATTKTVFSKSELTEVYEAQEEQLLTRSENFEAEGSNFSLIRILQLDINVYQYTPLRNIESDSKITKKNTAASYIKLPKEIEDKKACINVQNFNDEYCFKWALLACFYETSRKKHKTSTYPFDITSEKIEVSNGLVLDFTNLTFPLKVVDVKKFEAQNPSISVTVFGLSDKNSIIGPYYLTKEEKSHHVNLLLIQKKVNTHYVLISNISRLVRRQLTKHCRNLLFCNTCLQYSHNHERIEDHKKVCGKKVTILPNGIKEDNILRFKNYKKKLHIPFVVYADFECILQNEDIAISDRTKNVKQHYPTAFAYFIKCSFNDNHNVYRQYCGKDPAKVFVKNIINDCINIYKNVLCKKVPLTKLTPEEETSFNESLCCHICEKRLYVRDRVRDHDHLTGKYRGAAHKDCNLNFQIPNYIPILFHNFSAYDCHLFVTELAAAPGNIKILPLNKEKYISISKFIGLKENGEIKNEENKKEEDDYDYDVLENETVLLDEEQEHGNQSLGEKNKRKDYFELRFLDSFRFMASSLDSLAKELGESNMSNLKKCFRNIEEFNLLRRKGVFPYEYNNSIEKLKETSLPPISNFFNSMTKSKCSDEDYNHALKVWNTFRCKNLKEYMMIYLKTDVMLLSDIFENFRAVCEVNYKLDPCQYFTIPGLSWDAMLMVTNIKLDLFTDIDMYNFMKRSIRGGLVQCCKKRSVANNKYMEEQFDPKKPSKYITYLDANNLYGWAMSQYLPYGNFEWVKPDNSFNEDFILSLTESSKQGYIFEVDLEYPKNSDLHDRHNDLPFCPENKKAPNSKFVKLIADLTDKKGYVIHYRNLQQCIQNGLKLKKITKILKFQQSDWLQEYIKKNTELRQGAQTTFQKNFFKLLNNAVYGKTMENVEKRKNIHLVNSWESKGRKLGARALIAKPNYHSLKDFGNDVLAIELEVERFICNKPIYLGFTVLELSKLKMYDFHYSYIKPKFGKSVKLNYMDTDSFVYTIETEDYYKDIHSDIRTHFDTSGYPEENRFKFPRVNNKIIGFMKDEVNGEIITEFIGLRSKMYSFQTFNGNEVKKAKGASKSITRNLSLRDYRNCLINNKFYFDNMLTFKSKLHKIYTQESSKLILANKDDKRCIIEDDPEGNTLAWGHYKITPNEEN